MMKVICSVGSRQEQSLLFATGRAGAQFPFPFSCNLSEHDAILTKKKALLQNKGIGIWCRSMNCTFPQ